MMMMRRWICFFQLVLLLLQHFNDGAAQSVIKTLPGYPGDLPVHLETGYVGLGENDEVQLFYYFVESEGSPRKYPLILWFNGGPGCSGLTGLVYQIGPITFDFENFDGSLPSIIQNPYAWTKGTITQWTRCNKSLAYDADMDSVINYHKLLSEKPYGALIFSGDHDTKINYMATLKWIHSLNLILTVDEDWRPWNIDGQVAGYTEKYTYKEIFYLTFVTIKGAGHTAPEYKPRECLVMVDRWFSLYPI